MPDQWCFACAGQLIFGQRACQRLPEVLHRLGGQRLLVVTDANLIEHGLWEQVGDVLDEHWKIEVFDEGEPEPSLAMVERCITVARDFAPDVLLALGGGSNMDTAKLTALCLAQGGQPRDYAGDERVTGPMHPLLCMPTTAGTGSEVSSAAVYTDTEAQQKVGVLSHFLRPHAAIVDPLLTLSCPPQVTADAGIDALTHAIEAYTATPYQQFDPPGGQPSAYQGKHPLADACAERAIRLIGQYLSRVTRDGQDLEAREGMALAATFAGLAFSNVGVALVHALEYPLGAVVHVSHGRGNGILLPYVMRYNLNACPSQFADIARWLGAEVSDLDVDAAALEAVVAVERLRAEIGIPHTLAPLGVSAEQLPAIAERAFTIQRMMRLNPRCPSVEDLQTILCAAL